MKRSPQALGIAELAGFFWLYALHEPEQGFLLAGGQAVWL